MLWFLLALAALGFGLFAPKLLWACGFLAALAAGVMGITGLLGGAGQILLFLGLTGGFWLLGNHWLHNLQFNRDLGQEADLSGLVGAGGVISTPVENSLDTGYVRIGGVERRARSRDGQYLSTGTPVEVTAVRGLLLEVTPKKTNPHS